MEKQTVWVVEWQHADGRWFAWLYDNGVRNSRAEAWASMQKIRAANPGETFRTTKYVPAREGA